MDRECFATQGAFLFIVPQNKILTRGSAGHDLMLTETYGPLYLEVAAYADGI
jgi:hypothetical protein